MYRTRFYRVIFFLFIFLLETIVSLQLSPTTFVTGIKDKLAPVDVYKQTSAKSPLDAITLDVNLNPSTIAGLMGGNLGLPVNLIASYSKANGISISASALLSGIVGSNPALKSALSLLNPSTLSAISKVTGNASIVATIGSITSKINNTNLSNLTGISAMIAGISGTAFPIGFTDTSALSNLTVNLLNQANTLGIPNAYTQIALGLVKNPTLLQAVTKAILPSVVKSSNVNMLSNIAQGPAAKTVKASNPSFITSFASNFTLPPNTPQNQLPAIGAIISTSFSSIDPSWNKVTTSTGATLNNNNVTDVMTPDFELVTKAANQNAACPTATNYSVWHGQSAAQAAASPIPPAADGTPTVVNSMLSNPDGTTFPMVTYTYPDGTITTVKTFSDSSVSTKTWFPAQPTVDPTPAVTSNECVLPPLTPTPYSPDTNMLTGTQVTPFTTGITDPTTNTFPMNSISTTSIMANGNTSVNTTLPDNSSVGVVTSTNDTKTVIATPVTDPAALTSFLSTQGIGDPMASTSKAIVTNPLAMGSVMSDFTASATAESIATGSPSLLTANASDALASSFPNTSLDGISSFTQ